ncbi:MAG: hypothetical protein HN995_13640 [Candidatus Marinimicrobia bacterium]|jgi:tetratricopeptide (TPR) repeat protein|nr:hypothetical protein [Candidatus Neomarinimicrobiota bacterium]MBT4295784.1 hypothetical protein [Candidatus Neomarinimicrobiota bacterium]MBT4994354.1 hypothetical protein [Candidatus Neomarinimicrobiota bacterium]MBT6217870.1 hypothetical protein [Candidatus Neomarinimicrobiota bacterium]MBT6948217.1 hypothetical protein [Candidatus Neomarinimicrobiota bacterium]
MVAVAIQCCICGDNIDEDAHKFDPCYLEINTNITGDEEQQLPQAFFAHYECFKGIMAYDGHLNLEGQEAYVANNYLRAGKYKEAIDLYEKLLPIAEEPEGQQFILPNMIQCYKQLNDVAKQKELLEHGLELCSQGHESAGIYYEAAASAYASDDFQKAKDYIEKSKKAKEDDDDDGSDYTLEIFSAELALHLALDEHETARLICTEWLDEMVAYIPTSFEETKSANPVNACIQYLQDAELMYRLAESDFVRSSTPSIEFANKGLAERMRGNDEKAYKAFLEYKRILREQIETRGEDFEGYWKKLKSDKPEVSDFHIPDPDDDVPTQILVDEYIERYGK